MSSVRAVYKLVIPLKLHSLNEYIGACRKNPHAGAKMKRTDQDAVEWYIRSQLRGVRINKPVTMFYRFYEPNRKRDLDNVSSFARKVCQDGLVACGVLKNDGWNYISGYVDSFYIDRKRPRIEIDIVENG